MTCVVVVVCEVFLKGEKAMPIRRLRLSRSEAAAQLVCLKQLQAEGIDVEIPEERQEVRCDLDIDLGAPWENSVSEVRNGGIGYYAIYLRVIAKRSGLILPESEISTAWDPEIQINSVVGEDPLYDFGGQLFPRNQILNPRILNSLRFQARGDTIEGWLLASGLRPIPAEYRNFAVVPFQLSFWNQFGDEFRAQGTLSVLRKSQRDNTGVRRGSGLYGLDEAGKPPELYVEEDPRRWPRQTGH
jgi:hypothetical protein